MIFKGIFKQEKHWKPAKKHHTGKVRIAFAVQEIYHMKKVDSKNLSFNYTQTDMRYVAEYKNGKCIKESYYDENQMLTSAGALAGTKNYFYKLNPEMKSVDTDASWTITNENVEDEAHAGCAEIEYKASDSDNDSRTYYYVNKESGDVTIEEYISGKRIKSVETFNAKDEISE